LSSRSVHRVSDLAFGISLVSVLADQEMA